jgi:hypothetical protein
MWGIDVDPIAIQLTITKLFKYSRNIDDVQQIRAQFIIGNPLIYNKKCYEVDEKIELAALSRIYNENMGLDLEEVLEHQKFDIVLGIHLGKRLY